MHAIKVLIRTTQRLLRDERGLVTVEWVALAAAVVVGGIVIAYEVLNGMDPVAKNIATTLQGTTSGG